MRLTAIREVVPYVPFWADQVQYLAEAYRGDELIRQHGLIVGTYETVRLPRAQGWLIQTLASLHMQIVGPGRIGALDVNLALLLIWLGVTSYAVKRAFGVSASLVALGLMLSTAIVLNHPAGPFDFRLDFATMCLWGILVILIAVSSSQLRWTNLAAILVVGSLLVVNRFISFTYLLPFGALVTLLAIVTNWRTNHGWRRLWSPMILVVTAWAAVVGLIVVLNFTMFEGYYVQGHVTGTEPALRRLQVGVEGLRDDLLFYPKTVIREQLTRSFHIPATLGLMLSFTGGVRVWWSAVVVWWSALFIRKPEESPFRVADWVPSRTMVWFLGVATLALVAPYIPLTLAQQKHPVVS